MDRTKAEEILFDIEYWRKVLDDVQSLNKGLVEISENLKALIPASAEEFYKTSTPIMDAIIKIQDIILEKQNSINGLVELADGRFKYLKGKWEEEKNA